MSRLNSKHIPDKTTLAFGTKELIGSKIKEESKKLK